MRAGRFVRSLWGPVGWQSRFVCSSLFGSINGVSGLLKPFVSTHVRRKYFWYPLLCSRFLRIPLVPSGDLWSSLLPSGTLRFPLVPLGSHWCLPLSFRRVLFAFLLFSLVSSGSLWFSLLLSASLWSPLVPSGCLWCPLVPLLPALSFPRLISRSL